MSTGPQLLLRHQKKDVGLGYASGRASWLEPTCYARAWLQLALHVPGYSPAWAPNPPPADHPHLPLASVQFNTPSISRRAFAPAAAGLAAAACSPTRAARTLSPVAILKAPAAHIETAE